MTIPDNAAQTPILPSFTGNAALDSLIVGGIGRVALFAAGIMVTWLNAHGFDDPNLKTMILGILTTTLVGLATLVWTWVSRKRAEIVAQVTRTVAVRAGAAHAMDPNTDTPPPKAISPVEAQAIVAAYEPAVVTPDLNHPIAMKP